MCFEVRFSVCLLSICIADPCLRGGIKKFPVVLVQLFFFFFFSLFSSLLLVEFHAGVCRVLVGNKSVLRRLPNLLVFDALEIAAVSDPFPHAQFVAWCGCGRKW